MQLTQFTDYSLRALIYIALKKKSCTIGEISRVYGISRNHLLKIIHNLSKLGYIKTTRGKNGGILLSDEALGVNLKKLIVELEAHLDFVPCFNVEKQNCCIAPVCRLKMVLYEAREAFLSVLLKYTLGDMISNKDELQKIFDPIENKTSADE